MQKEGELRIYGHFPIPKGLGFTLTVGSFHPEICFGPTLTSLP